MTIRKTFTKRGIPDKKKVNNNNNNGYYDHVYCDQDLLTCANDDVVEKAFSNSWSGIRLLANSFLLLLIYSFLSILFYYFTIVWESSNMS